MEADGDVRLACFDLRGCDLFGLLWKDALTPAAYQAILTFGLCRSPRSQPAAEPVHARSGWMVTTARSRARSQAVTVTMIPLRMAQTRTPGASRESSIGLGRQIECTSSPAGLPPVVSLCFVLIRVDRSRISQ
jgi:hypothetical protein